MSTQYGHFNTICRDSTLPVCNLFTPSHNGSGYGGCELTGIPLGSGHHLANLGSIILCAIAIVISAFLIWRSENRRAAVGRREMQLLFVGYIIIEICEIFTVGGFPLSSKIRIAFTGIHIGMIVATTWILLVNGIVGYPSIDDGTFLSLSLALIPAAALFIGTAYIALDTGYGWTSYWNSTHLPPYRSYSLYTLYQLVPLVFLVIYFVLETYLVLGALGETTPMLYLGGAVLSFAVGQIFNYLVSDHICTGTHGKIDGSMFETLFTLIAIVLIWIFWSSITEEDWPTADSTEEEFRQSFI